jgi:predicted oxidoreductase
VTDLEADAMPTVIIATPATILAWDRLLAERNGVTEHDPEWPMDCPACLHIHGQGTHCPVPALRPEFV